MSGVKKLFQRSENSAKSEYIHDHMFDGFGILAGNIRKWACISLSIRLHDGFHAAREWEVASIPAASHVVQMVEDDCHAAKAFSDCLLLLDRCFLTVPALETLAALNRSKAVRLEIITKAKQSCMAFEKPGPKNREGAASLKNQKKNEAGPLEQVSDEKGRNNILKAIRATEMHMALSCMEMGILQGLSIHFARKSKPSQPRYQKTPARGRVSEAALMHYLRKYFFLFMKKQPELFIAQIIRMQQDESGAY